MKALLFLAAIYSLIAYQFQKDKLTVPPSVINKVNAMEKSVAGKNTSWTVGEYLYNNEPVFLFENNSDHQQKFIMRQNGSCYQYNDSKATFAAQNDPYMDFQQTAVFVRPVLKN